ncbi:MAG: hypothetical protein WC505_04050 [Patescibacteria group bacterium]
MSGTEWFLSISLFLAKHLLLQTNPLTMIIVFLSAIILLMMRIKKPRLSYTVKTVAIILLIWASANGGWYLCYNGWGVDVVNYERLEKTE